MGHLGQRIGLVHELGQLACSEKRVDYRRQGFGVYKVDRGEYLIVPYIHPFPDGSCHTGQTDTELVGQLFANSPDPSVAQVVDIVNNSFGVYQLDQVTDNFNNVLFCQYPGLIGNVEVELMVEPVPSNLAKVVSFIGEEQFVYDIPCRSFVRWF
ncbi:hypothetical protein SDC9_78564 [bioreactor metagenome]|uniref:Uncharacterized protein n=1 Tax=bioreactor metagenome TaxID=1076179 RepID=A0A644YU08_9ZZZZ